MSERGPRTRQAQSISGTFSSSDQMLTRIGVIWARAVARPETPARGNVIRNCENGKRNSYQPAAQHGEKNIPGESGGTAENMLHRYHLYLSNIFYYNAY